MSEIERRVKVDRLTIDGPLEMLAGVARGEPAVAITLGCRRDGVTGLHLTWIADSLDDVRHLHQELGAFIAEQGEDRCRRVRPWPAAGRR